MAPEWAALLEAILLRIGQQAVQQAGWGTQPLVQAVRFACVCRAFRAAALAPGFFAPEPRLRLHWSLAGPVSSRLMGSWAPCFWAVGLSPPEPDSRPTVRLRPERCPAAQRKVTISVSLSQEQGETDILAACLALVPQLGAVDHLFVLCKAMSPAGVQLLADLRVTKLQILCSCGFRLDALPAADSTLVSVWANGLFAPDDAAEQALDIAWEAMTAARVSTFHFNGKVNVRGYAAQAPETYVEVCNETEDDDDVLGLPWPEMRAGMGWRSLVRSNRQVYGRGSEPSDLDSLLQEL